MEVNTYSDVCLGIAVDHRIRALCKPVSINSNEPSEHVTRIETLGKSLGRSRKETQVTSELAGPAYKGGIAITLQQPRDNHSFEKGIDAVIKDCPTLSALEEIFRVVSCGKLGLNNIGIIDLLPYMSDSVEDIHDLKLKKCFEESAQAICDKEPDVLLCAGKIRWPHPNRFEENKIKGDARKFENLGIGQKFGSKIILPVQAKIRRGDGSFVSVQRVNGFHPSYALYRRAYFSLLRQLLILVCAQACGMVRNDCESEPWMDELRSRCHEEYSRGTTDMSSPSHSSQQYH